MTSVLPDPAGIAEARTLGGNPQHNGALRFRGLPYALSRLGTVHVERWGGRSQPREKPRSTRKQFLIFCIFLCLIQGKGNLYIKGEGVCQPPWLPHVGLFPHGGCAPWLGAPALVGPKLPTRGQPSFFFFPYNSFPLIGP